jgi:hypothetical protein
VRGFVEYLAACVLIMAIIATAIVAFSRGAVVHVVIVSAVTALAVQLGAFLVARAFRVRNMLLGWGLGSAMRLVALVIYAVLVARLWRATMAPALLSFAAFLFVTTVVEPVFLKR